MSTERANPSLKQVACIEIRVFVVDSANNGSGGNTLQDRDGFRTSYRVALSMARVGHNPTYELLIDGIVKISLTEKEYWLVKALIKQMLSDAKDMERSPSSFGWLTKEELTDAQSSSGAKFWKNDLAAGLFDLRNKLKKHNVSRDLIETDKEKRVYRISTSPQNLSVPLP